MTEDLLRELADRREIEDVLYRYAHALDSKHWDRLGAEVFTADAVCDFLELGGVHEGAQAAADFIASVLGGLDASQHLIGTPLIDVAGDTARSRCYLQAQHVFLGAEGGDHFLVGGTYVDDLARTPDGWRITRRELHGTWQSGNPGVFTAAVERLAGSA